MGLRPVIRNTSDRECDKLVTSTNYTILHFFSHPTFYSHLRRQKLVCEETLETFHLQSTPMKSPLGTLFKQECLDVKKLHARSVTRD